MQITLDLPDSLTQTDTFNQSDWLREIAITFIIKPTEEKSLMMKAIAH
jgi:predicted HTH domain antitoxin